MPDQGDIVLVPVPFTDLSSQKRRPVIVISNDGYNRAAQDVIVVAMTSNPAITPYSFRGDSADLIEGALNRPGTVRVE
jgi:mRNA interferase MazF